MATAPSEPARVAGRKRTRAERRAIAQRLAAAHGGVVTRQMLQAEGITRSEIRAEIERGVWTVAGCHTLCITTDVPQGRGRWWWALWESGAGAVLDGSSALLAAGLSGWEERAIHVSVSHRARVRSLPGVVHHHLRQPGAEPADIVSVGLRRTKPDLALIRGAQWAASDRQAATVIAMTVQQRLAAPAQVLERWSTVRYSARRQLIHDVIHDVCNGAHSMNELDFARLCRRGALPEPTRQTMRQGHNGRVYLDVLWEDVDLHVEIQGAQHLQGTAGIEDALRTNDLGLRTQHLVSLQVPVLGLRSCPELFLAQIERGLARAHERRAG